MRTIFPSKMSTKKHTPLKESLNTPTCPKQDRFSQTRTRSAQDREPQIDHQSTLLVVMVVVVHRCTGIGGRSNRTQEVAHTSGEKVSFTSVRTVEANGSRATAVTVGPLYTFASITKRSPSIPFPLPTFDQHSKARSLLGAR